MMAPSVKTTVAIAQLSNSTFTVLAYRQLTDQEMVMAWRMFRRSKAGKKKMKENTNYTVVSTIGLHD